MRPMEVGQIVNGPDGMAYRITRDVRSADDLRFSDFEPLGGAPEPIAGNIMPEWLAAFVFEGRDR